MNYNHFVSAFAPFDVANIFFLIFAIFDEIVTKILKNMAKYEVLSINMIFRLIKAVTYSISDMDRAY